ncbi:hypothetical protein Cgig2_001316 [Carnegiea gigantea]|uniref:U3 small nucleolar RNA-associated protein 20 domain-containing protein n=1 Tax=Carnegiea gigantea TaxID=171969 RepID=A0A9Q1KTP7_9CARY|nr:hypothetical protein Cgig2_001316 [Carnegiea gigantea]
MLKRVFIPLFFSILFDVQTGQAEHLRSACINALASVSGQLRWNSYYDLLMRCFRDMTKKPDREKVLIRLVCSILDHFHFSETCSIEDAKIASSDVMDQDPMASAEVVVPVKSANSVKFSEIQSCLVSTVLPKLQKLLVSDSAKVNVNISLAMLKVLKILPSDTMESQLPSIIYRISNFLKNCLDSIRDESRSALAACLKVLGFEYLPSIVGALRATLKRGFEVHVLGYTLHFILSKGLPDSEGGKVDCCFNELLCVIDNDIFGEVAEQKDVVKIASKMKETKKQRSFDTLKLIAQIITFRTHGLKLLSPVTARLRKHLTQKVKLKLETMLNCIAEGIEKNPSVDQTDLFVFIYGLIDDWVSQENRKTEISPDCMSAKVKLIETSSEMVDKSCTGNEPFCSHLITVFALGLLHNRLRNIKFSRDKDKLVSMLDPFIKLLTSCLSSKYEEVVSVALKCIFPLIRLPLPSLESQADKIKGKLLDIAQSSANVDSPITQSCLKLYEHATGREAVLEMLGTIIKRFPESVINQQSQMLFVHLVVALANDHDNQVRSLIGIVIKRLISRISSQSLHSILEYCLAWYLGEKQHLWSTSAQVLGFVVEVMRRGFQKHISKILPVMRKIIQSAVAVLNDTQLNIFDQETIPFWKEAYYTLVLLEKILMQFPDLLVARDVEDIWQSISEFLMHPHPWICNISSRLVALYFEQMEKQGKKVGTTCLTSTSRMFLIASSLCCLIKAQLPDEGARGHVKRNLAYAICGIQLLLHQTAHKDPRTFWSSLDPCEQGCFLKACRLLGAKEGRSIEASFTYGLDKFDQKDENDISCILVSGLLKVVGKTAFHTEDIQTKTIVGSLKLIAMQMSQEDCQKHAFQLLLPIYKLCEGFSGKIVSDDVKQRAEKARRKIEEALGYQKFVQAYGQIRHSLGERRDKRKREEKVMAAVDPTKNAKRKLRISAKHKAHKKRKIMAMKMGRRIPL